MNYFKQKLGLYTQIGVITQSDNREITQGLGFHIRWQQLKPINMKNKILLTLFTFCISFGVNAQFFEKLTETVGDITNTTVKTITAPTEVLINTGKVATGNADASEIYKPIQQAVRQTGNTAVSTSEVISEPQKFFMQKAQEFSKSVGGSTGEFIFDVGTFSQRYYNELAQSGVYGINGVLQGQNPFQISAIPLAAAIRAANERYKSSAKPLPSDVKEALRPYFRANTLENARYIVGNVEITLPNFIGQGQKFFGNDAYAVTVGNIIVFNNSPGSYSQNAHWWAHEITHVEQYENLGIESFAYKYLKDFGSSIEKEAINRANSIVGNNNPQFSQSQSYALNVGSFDMSSSSIDNNRNFSSNPEIYVAQCIFPQDNFGVMYLVTNYGRIIAVNPLDGQWRHIGYSTPPRLPNVAWSYDLPNARWSYAVGMDGNIYNPVPIYNNWGQIIKYQWNIIGYVRKLI